MPISIVVAAYRGESMPKVVESIRNQDFTDFEIVIVNDAQESVREWYKSFKNDPLAAKTTFIDLERQTGRFGLYNRNIGIMASNHAYKWVVFHDDDNLWEPNHLSSLVEVYKTTGKFPYCYMHVIGKSEGSPVNHIKKTGFSRQGIDLGCILYRKEWFDKFGYFRDDRQVTFDYECIDRIFKGVGGIHEFKCTEKATFIFFHKRY